MLFRGPGEVLLVAQERASRMLLVSRQQSKAAAPIAEQLRRHFAGLPAALRQSVTFDNVLTRERIVREKRRSLSIPHGMCLTTTVPPSGFHEQGLSVRP